MKILLPVFFMVASVYSGLTQTFLPVPAPVLEREVAFEQANECYLFFNNPSGDSLQLRWRSLAADIPPDWVIDLCDYGLCYVGIPPNGTMNPVFDTIQPYLKLIVQPGTTPGSAWLWFRVFEKDHEDNYADVFFSLFTPGVTGVSSPEIGVLKAFPNPAAGYLFLENQGVVEQSARLLSTSGQTMWQQILPPGSRLGLETGAFPNGLYFLETNTLKIQKILIQK